MNSVRAFNFCSTATCTHSQPPTHAATPPRPLCESSLWTRRQEVDATSHSDACARAGGSECVCRLLSLAARARDERTDDDHRFSAVRTAIISSRPSAILHDRRHDRSFTPASPPSRHLPPVYPTLTHSVIANANSNAVPIKCVLNLVPRLSTTRCISCSGCRCSCRPISTARAQAHRRDRRTDTRPSHRPGRAASITQP